MTTAHELMEQLLNEGAGQFAATDLARDHAHVARRVRRDRVARTSLATAVSIVAIGATVFGAAHVRDAQLDPAVTPSTTPITPQPAVSHSLLGVSVAEQDRIDTVASGLASLFGVSTQESLQTLVNALPPEAAGNPEGWVLAGDHPLHERTDVARGLQAGADGLVATTTDQLEAIGVPRDEWAQTVILASIIQQEAPAGPSDQAAVARVLLNRIDKGMTLDVDSAPETKHVRGLPESAIGAFTSEALNAAAHPASGDWLFFLRDDTGSVRLFSDLESFSAAVEAAHPHATPTN